MSENLRSKMPPHSCNIPNVSYEGRGDHAGALDVPNRVSHPLQYRRYTLFMMGLLTWNELLGAEDLLRQRDAQWREALHAQGLGAQVVGRAHAEVLQLVPQYLSLSPKQNAARHIRRSQRKEA